MIDENVGESQVIETLRAQLKQQQERIEKRDDQIKKLRDETHQLKADKDYYSHELATLRQEVSNTKL